MNDIENIIKLYIARRNSSITELIKAIGISRATLYIRFSNPTEWRVGELHNVYEFLDVPEDERVVVSRKAR